MRLELIIWTVIILTGCNLTEKKNIEPAKDSSIYQIDRTQSGVEKIDETTETDPFDNSAKAYVDTSALQGKRQWIMNHFLSKNRLSSPDFDTLFDLTYDGYKDYVIGYYGQSGTGIKNRVEVYFYNTKKKCYI